MSETAGQGGPPPGVNSQVLPFAHRGISRAVALGWQVAQLFHSPVHQGPAADPPRGTHLPGRSEFPGASQSTWLGEQIQSQLEQLLADPPPVLNSLAEAFAHIRKTAKTMPKGEWIVLRYAFPTRLAEARFPTLKELDEAAPDHPVLFHAGPAGMVPGSLTWDPPDDSVPLDRNDVILKWAIGMTK